MKRNMSYMTPVKGMLMSSLLVLAPYLSAAEATSGKGADDSRPGATVGVTVTLPATANENAQAAVPNGLKRRGDGSIDDSQPGGSGASNSRSGTVEGIKRRGDGSTDNNSRDRGHAEHGDRAKRADRANRADRADRINKADRVEGSERPERTERVERVERVERAERTERPERVERIE